MIEKADEGANVGFRHGGLKTANPARQIAMTHGISPQSQSLSNRLRSEAGGESGIRTRVTVSRKHTFQACAFNHSATSPRAPEAWA
jgi:hypothetical protein